MMRCLLGDVVTSSVVRIVPIARKGFAEDGVEGFLDPSCGSFQQKDIVEEGLVTYGGLMCQPLR